MYYNVSSEEHIVGEQFWIVLILMDNFTLGHCLNNGNQYYKWSHEK